MLRLVFALVFVVLVASTSSCAPEKPRPGGITLDTTDTTFGIVVENDSPLSPSPGGALQTLLSFSTTGAGAYAPAAVRTTKAKYEMQYGSWKITEPGDDAWVEAHRFGWTSTSSTKAQGAWRDANGKDVVQLTATATDFGELKLDWNAADSAVNRLSLSFSCAEGDRFIGFGGQADAVDHAGHTVAIWNSEPGIGKRMTDDEYPELWMLEGTRHASSYGLPTWISNHSYQGVVEADARTVFEVCSKQTDTFRIEVWSNHFTLWVFHGIPADALSRATGRVLGRPVRPPPLAFAPWNDAIFGSANVRAMAKLLRDNHIPSGAIWTEDFRGGTPSGDSYRLVENWDLDRTLYPDAEALAAELKDQGFSWFAYFNPFLVQGNPVFDEATAGGHFVGNQSGGPYLFDGPTFKPTGLADLSRPETREWVKSHLRKALDQGFTGWMADFGEWLPHDAVLASGENPLEAHNRYPREWAQVNQEVLAERASDGVQRLFFARAGWLGSNALAPVVWAGDQRTSFQKDDGLFTVIPMGINLGLAGVATFGSDVSGYQSATNPPPTKELFFRWVELGALSPVMRTHHGTAPKLGWKLDSDAETLAHYKRYATWHAQLFPYFDAYSAEASVDGIPLVRSFVLHYPYEAPGWSMTDEYLLGGALLVAPVVDEGATSRSVYFPGDEWVSWNGDQHFFGPGSAMVPAPLGEIPVFAQAGAVIPMLPKSVDTFIDSPVDGGVVDLKQADSARVIRVFVGRSSQFSEADGTQYTLQAYDTTLWKERTTELPDCLGAERGCVDRTGVVPVVRMTSQGPVAIPGAVFSMTGPKPRTIDLEVVIPKK